MKTPQVGQILSVKIHGLGSSGEGVGSHNGYTLFIDGALPDEEVEVRLTQCRKRYGIAKLLTIKSPSPNRVSPPCPLFGRCGGCQLMHLSYAKQLDIKRQRVIDALQRIGKIENPQVEYCQPSPSPLAYRNKIQLPAQKGPDGLELGLYARSSHQLIRVDHCYIHCALGERIYATTRKILQRFAIMPYDPTTGEGELRHLLIKSALRTEEALVILVTHQKPSPQLFHMAEEILAADPAIRGVVHNLQQNGDNTILGDLYTTLAGTGSIREILAGLTFKVSPASFFQVNPAQAERLYAKALEYADLQGDETVLDAYCGVGTLSLFFASAAKRVLGVECVPEAILDAQANSRLNGIENVSFLTADTEVGLKSLPTPKDPTREPLVLLLNPPRKGCSLACLQEIGRLSPSKIIYISCDPATLARDLAELLTYGYQLQGVQPYDMFPQTSHVECVVKLVK